MPEKSIICAMQKEDDRFVDYYVSDEAKWRDILVRYKEERWREDEKELDDIGFKLEETVKPISKMKMNYFKGSYIVFKSCLYRLGGITIYNPKGSRYGYIEFKNNKIVNKLDLTKMESESGWVRVSNMRRARDNPQPVILGDELYVVGGLSNRIKEESRESFYLMEVLKSDGFDWELISNPPNGFDRNSTDDVVAGVYKSKNIIVGMSIPSSFVEYSFYIYKVEEKKWEWKTKIKSNMYYWSGNSSRMVWGELIIFLGYDQLYTLCIMDLEGDTFHTIDLLQALVSTDDTGLPPSNAFTYLVMIEPGKFCFFWGVKGPKSSSGEHDILEACIFTLIKNKNINIKRSCNCNCSCSVHALEATFRVNIESRFSSFIPNPNNELYAVLLVDYIPQDIISKLQV